MPTVRANQSVVATVDGNPLSIREGDAFDTTHPAVAQHPWLFTEPVEQATAAPGERRATRRKAQP